MAITNADLAQMIADMKGTVGELTGTVRAIKEDTDRARSERKGLYEKIERIHVDLANLGNRASQMEARYEELSDAVETLDSLPGAVKNLQDLEPVVDKLENLRMRTVYVGLGIVAVAGVLGYIASLFVAEIKAAIIRIFGG